MELKKLKTMLASAICMMGIHSTTVSADVIELSLLLDGSGSLGFSGWTEQINAYGTIFGSATFYDDYVVGGDTLWVNAVQFAGPEGPGAVTEMITWTEITDNASANAFGAGFAGQAWNRGYTPTRQAVEDAAFDLQNNGIMSDRMVIDISTDGLPCQPGVSCNNPSNPYMLATLTELQIANIAGITTNFIGVGNGVSVVALSDLAAAGGGFYTIAADFTEFQSALETKLFREIQGVPAPATLALLGFGLVGIGFGRRKKVS